MADALVANSSDHITNDARDNSPCYLWATDGYSDNTRLPEEWDVRVTPDHRVYFLEYVSVWQCASEWWPRVFAALHLCVYPCSHTNKKTCWTHPVLKRRYNVVPRELLHWEPKRRVSYAINLPIHIKIIFFVCSVVLCVDLPYGWQRYKDTKNVLMFVEWVLLCYIAASCRQTSIVIVTAWTFSSIQWGKVHTDSNVGRPERILFDGFPWPN